MDDSRRNEHEKAFEAALAAILIEYSEIAAQTPVIDSEFWNSMRSDAIARLKPISLGVQYEAGLKLADKHDVYLAGSFYNKSNSNAEAIVGARVDQMIAGIQQRAAEQKSKKDWESIATALMVATLINEINPETWSIGMSTRSYTMGERVAANAINFQRQELLGVKESEEPADIGEVLGETYQSQERPSIIDGTTERGLEEAEEELRDLIDSQLDAPDFGVPFPDDDRYAPVEEEGDYRRLVAYWMAQEDDLVCEICLPLHLMPLNELPEEYQEGPEAHPRCRCYLEWILE